MQHIVGRSIRRLLVLITTLHRIIIVLVNADKVILVWIFIMNPLLLLTLRVFKETLQQLIVRVIVADPLHEVRLLAVTAQHLVL